MATQRQAQVPLPLPQTPRRVPWKAIAILAIAAVALLAIGAVASTLFGGSNSSPTASSEAPKYSAPQPPAAASQQRAAPNIEYAAPIPGAGVTPGIYTKPGRPGQMTDGGQVAASFILLASYGRIDEAVQLSVIPSNSPQFRAPDGTLKIVDNSRPASPVLRKHAELIAQGGPLATVHIREFRMPDGVSLTTVDSRGSVRYVEQKDGVSLDVPSDNLMISYTDVETENGDLDLESIYGAPMRLLSGFGLIRRQGAWYLYASGDAYVSCFDPKQRLDERGYLRYACK